MKTKNDGRKKVGIINLNPFSCIRVKSAEVLANSEFFRDNNKDL